MTTFLNDSYPYERNTFDLPAINQALEEYRIGITKSNDTIFYQIDVEGRCRTGKS